MPTDYLFLIPLMPPAMLEREREELRKLCFKQLQKLKCTYSVWLLGEGIATDDLPENFRLFESNSTSKEDKLFEAGKILETENSDFRYLVRLDDDDLINPEVFDACAKIESDSFVDSMHWFYDLSSAKISKQERPWFPNTIIHAYAHAIAKIEANGGSAKAGSQNYLFACDHSQAWHNYYQNHIITLIPPDNPLYIRVLNPGSITASENGTGERTDYLAYLTTFGDWKEELPRMLLPLKSDLIEIWNKTSGDLQKYQFPENRLWNKLKRRIRK